LKPEKSKEHYVPRVFGFKLHRTWHQKSLEAARRAQLEYQEEKRRLEASKTKNPTTVGDPNVAANVDNANGAPNANGNNSGNGTTE